MSLAIDVTTLRPLLRPEVVFGPPILSRGVFAYYMKDKVTRGFYRIGAKEYFLVSRMNGKLTLQEIGTEYEMHVGKSLSDKSWAELLKLLEKRQLLVGSETPTSLKDLKKEIQKKGRKERGIFRAKIALVNPDAFLGKILPVLRFAFHPVFVGLALAVIGVLEVFFFSHLSALVSNIAADYRSRVIDIWFLVIVVITLVAHELAHGLACKRFGGSVQEIGVGWRYLVPFPYCQLDDVVLFQNHWHRVYAAFAGIFTNLLMLLPFALLWYFSPEQSVLKALSSVSLVFINFTALFNLIPFVELDGYLMLTHALNIADLRKDAHQLYVKNVKRLLMKGKEPVRYARHHSVYLIYGACSLMYTTVFTTFIAVRWFILLELWLGGLTAWLVTLALVLILLVLKGPGRDWMKKRKGY